MSQQNQVSEITLQHTVTIAAALPAKKQTYASLQSDIDSTTAQESIQIPNNEAWIVMDIFINTAADVPNADGDCWLTLEKNRNRKLASFGLLSTMIQSNQQRSKPLKPYGFEAGSIMRIIATNAQAPVAQRVNTFYMKVGKLYR